MPFVWFTRIFIVPSSDWRRGCCHGSQRAASPLLQVLCGWKTRCWSSTHCSMRPHQTTRYFYWKQHFPFIKCAYNDPSAEDAHDVPQVLRSPTRHTLESMVAHFQKLFDAPSLTGIYPRMNEVYTKLGEMNNAMRNLRDVLDLGIEMEICWDIFGAFHNSQWHMQPSSLNWCFYI